MKYSTRLLPCTVGLFLALAGCARAPEPPATLDSIPYRMVSLTCTTPLATETRPCGTKADEMCGNASTLYRIDGRTPINVAQGATAQPVAMLYQYSVIYRCAYSAP